jgi:hypothetical protein
LEYPTAYSALINAHITTSWCPHIVIIIVMSDHIGPVIKEIHDFNAKYSAAWAIEAHETLEEHVENI